MSFYLGTPATMGNGGTLEHFKFDSKDRAKKMAIEIAISRSIPTTDVLVVEASSDREAQREIDKHFDAAYRARYGK